MAKSAKTAADLLRQAISELEGQQTCGQPTAHTRPPTTSTVLPTNMAVPEGPSTSVTETVPDRSTRKLLIDAALGEKKITMVKNKDSVYFRDFLCESFPKLKESGGYELMRTGGQSRHTLEVLQMPGSGYTSQFLSDESGLGGAVAYIRPLQKDLSLDPVSVVEPSEDCIKEECVSCGELIPVISLRDHISECKNKSEQSEDEALHPVTFLGRTNAKRPKMVERPICDFTCRRQDDDSKQEKKIDNSSNDDKHASHEYCPICGVKFKIEDLEEHADSCLLAQETADTTDTTDTTDRGLKYQLQKKHGELHKESWRLSIVRKKLSETVMDQLKDASEQDWEKTITVKFIGEDAVDVGGPLREMFSLFFQSSPMMEGNTLTYSADLLQENAYFLYGRAVAYSLIAGHPGPRNLHPLLVKYILKDETPTATQIEEADIDNSEVLAVIRKIQDCSDDATYGDIIGEHYDILDKAGFRQVLSSKTKDLSVNSLKVYWLFYRILGPLRQIMEGLKDKGILKLLQSYPDESTSYLSSSAKELTADEVKDFYYGSFSTDLRKKSLEEVTVYHFHKFLSQVEKGKVTCEYFDMDKPDKEAVPIDISIKDVMQALVGCPGLPTNIESGLILFDHDANDRLSSVNTCAPSITLTQLSKLQSYKNFEEMMISIIIGAKGFGME